MKKIISLLVVLAMLMSMAPAVFATETTEYQEVTIPEAIELAEEGSSTKYLVRGTVTSVANTTYGNLYIEDAEGNSLYVYGLYSVDGVTRYDAMETKPQAGDEVLLLGVLTTYNSNPQMKNAWLQELNGEAFEAPETEPDPEADTELTVAEAIALGASKAHNTYTEGKYYVTGEITEIYNTTYGNMYIADEDGNTLTIYGTYDADGTNRFDAMENQPAVGDTITVYGIIGQYNGTPQMKNGWIQEAAEEEPETPVEGPLEGNILVVGNNKLTSHESATEYTFTAAQAGTLYLTIRNYTCNGIEYGERMLQYKWSQILVDDVALTAMQTTLEVTEGQVLTVVMTTDGDSYESNLYLSFEGFYQEPEGGAFNPIKVFPGDCPLDAEIGAGEEVYYHLSYENYDDNSFTDDHILYVYGENAYVVYEGWVDGERGDIYAYAENGVVTYAVWNGYDIRIGNAGDAAATFEVDTEIPVGAEGNPAQLVLGDNVTEMTAEVTRYYYTWTAEAPGTLTLTVSGDSYWNISAENLIAGDYYYQSEKGGDEGVINFVVAQGDVITAYLSLYNDDYESIDGTLTLNAAFVEGQGEDLSLHLENNFVKVRNNYGPAVTKEYTYVAEQSGTLYITFRSFGAYGYYWEESSLSDEYNLQCVNIFINGVQTTVFQNSVEVNEGDSVVVTIASLDGYPYEANIWLSYEGFYEEPVGSELNPVVVDIEELPTNTVEIPAGEDLHYKFTGEYYDYTLHIYGENAYIVVEQYNYETYATEEVYIYAENGVIEYALKNGAEIRIGNAGEAADTFYMEATIPLGIYNNPDTLIIGEQVAPVPADYNGYWYTWTAPEAGTLTITVIGEGWGFDLSNYATSTYIYNYEMDGDSNTASIDVAEGDEIRLNVLILGPNGWGDYPGGELTVVAEFAPEGGEESGVSGWLHAYVKTDSGYAWVKINAATGEFEALSDYSEVAYTGAGQGNDGMIYAYVDGKYVQIDPNNGYAVTEGGTDAYSVPINDATASAPEQVVTLIDEKSGEAVEVTVGGYLHYVSMDNWNTPYLVKLMDYTEPKTERKYNYDFEDTGMEAIAYLNCELLADNTYFYETYLVVNSNGDLYKLTEKTKVYDTTRGWRRSVELIADLNLDVSNGASMTMLNETTAVIAANNASGVTLYTYDLTAGVLTELYTLAGATELIGLENYVVPAAELELGYNFIEMAAGEENAYTWTAETDGLFAISMMSANWSYTINGVTYTSADEKPVYMTIIEVAAGDVVTLNVGTADGAADTLEFTTNAYAVGDPIDIQFVFDETYTSGAINVDMPAGDFTFMMYNGSGMTLTVDGVVTEMTGDGWFDPITFNVTNAEAGIVEMTLTYPVGAYYNPAQLPMGYNSCDIEEYSQQGYWYTYTAESDGLFALSMLSDNWFYSAMIQRADGTYGYPDGHYSDETDDEGNPFVIPVQVLELKAGDVLLLNFGTADYAAATVEFTANVYAGDASDPVYLPIIWNNQGTAAALNADLPAGEYVYSLDVYSTVLQVTINGELAALNIDPMGWDPSTVVINNTGDDNAVFTIEVNYPVGTMFNPDELELGYQEGQMIMFDSLSRWYSYTATEDTLLAIELMGENWYYWGVYMNADGSYDYSRMTATYSADADPLVPMTVIKLAAGETFALCIGTIDGSEIVEFSAMTYAGTEEDPILFNYCWTETETGRALNADLPAGEYVYGARINGMVLTVNGVETEYTPGMGRYPCTFTINNTESGVVALEANVPVGSIDNPEIVDEGEHTVEIEAETYTQYWYSFTAPDDGTLTVTVSSTAGYLFVVNNVTAGIYSDEQWSDEDPVNPMTIQVAAGDVVHIMVAAYDSELGLGAGATITVDLQFTPKPDVVLGDVNGDGVVDTTDAKLIMQYDLGLIDETALTLEAADVNGDGAVDTTDAKLVMQLDLGLIEEF